MPDRAARIEVIRGLLVLARSDGQRGAAGDAMIALVLGACVGFSFGCFFMLAADVVLDLLDGDDES